MPIALPCPKCKAKLKGPDQLVGRTIKCPGCGTPVTIPASAVVSPPPAAPPKLPAAPKTESKADLDFIPRMQLDDDAPSPPPRVPTPSKEPLAEKKTVEPPSLFDLPDDIGFKDDPAPAPAPPPKPEQTKAPPPEKKPAEGAFPNMQLDDEPADKDEPYSDFMTDDEEEVPDATVEEEEVPDAKIDEEEVPAATVDEEEAPVAAVEEEAPVAVVDEDDVAVAVVDEEEAVWVDPVQDESAEDDLAVVAEEDDLLDVVAVDEDDLDVVEAAGPDVTFRLLQMPRLHVRSQSGLFAITNAYDLVNPKNKKKVGEAVERPEAAQQVLSLFVGKNVTSSKIEVVEGRNKLLMTIRRGAYFINATADIFDADDEKLGSFEIRPFSALTGNPLWITDTKDKKIIKLEMKLFSGRRYFRNKKGDLLAEWVHELTYEKKLIKFKLAARGNSFYLIFKELLDERPRDKMLILGASLGLDLLQAPTGQRGVRFGGT